MKPQRYVYFFAVCMSVAMMAGCQSSTPGTLPSDEADHTADKTLTVGVLPTLDCLPLYVAEELNLWEAGQTDVSLRRYNAHLDCDEHIINKDLDGAVSDLVRAERLKAKGIALEYPISTGTYWQLITNRLGRINELSQLGDKMLAITRFSATDYLGNLAVDSAKPKNTVFRIQVNDVNVRLKMLQTNAMDAMLLPEPQATAARVDKHPVLMDSRDKGLQLGVFVFRTDAVDKGEKRHALQGFLKAYNMACDSINTYGLAHYADIIKRNCHIDDRVMAALPKMRYEHAAPPSEKNIQAAKGVKWKKK